MTRDRDGSVLDLKPETHECTNGWSGEDWAGRPIPCRVCRPWRYGDAPTPTLRRNRGRSQPPATSLRADAVGRKSA